MKKGLLALISLLLLAFSLPLQACQSASGNSFEVLSMDVTPGKVIMNEKITVTATISNNGGNEAVFEVPVMVNGVADDRTSVTLAPGKSQEIQFTLHKGEPGTYEIRIGDKNSAVTVERQAPAEFKLSDLNINMDEANPGEEVVITACLSNTGGSEGTYIIDLKINGDAGQSDRVILPAGAKYNCVFKLVKSEPGTYGVAIGDLAGKFTVIKPIEVIQITAPDDTTYKRQSQRSSCCPEGSGSSCQ
ncbi:MAG: hypothetical protein NTZ34_07595 [Chloroflexi bacterium]|nr:hypothetical protein [Chloroflexota bacterium]